MMVFEQLPFMANGKGYIGQRRTGLGVYDRARGEFTRLTPPLMDVARTALNAKRTIFNSGSIVAKASKRSRSPGAIEKRVILVLMLPLFPATCPLS